MLAFPLTEAVKGCCSVGNLLAVRGLTLTLTPPPPPPPPPLDPPPPHEESRIVDASISTATAPGALRFEDLRAKPPITIPTADAHKKKGAHGRRFSALGRTAVLPNPLVLIVSVTFCVPLAPAVTAGVEHVAPAGNPEQVKFTAIGKVVAPTGVTTRL